MSNRGKLQRRYAQMAEDERARQRALHLGYDEAELRALPPAAVISFGCGNPLALAELRPGEVVLDLGSGVGLDALLAARRVGPTGRVIGVDATPEMVGKARRNASQAGLGNVSFAVSEIESLPLADASVDVALSNCVLNHCADKLRAFEEVRRCLRSNGRALITDLMFEGACDQALLDQVDPIWHEWLRLASPAKAYLQALDRAGFAVEVLGKAPYPAGEGDALAGQVTNLYLRATRRD
ncbi:methyltransferase domain-containing protein [bacterium]|nr:methyltransferase domain-containing protein [bacterium]